MALVPMKVILDAAEKGKFGVPALNINEMLQLQAYLNAGFELKSPLILQASMGSREFTGWLSIKKPDSDLGAGVTMEMIESFMNNYKAIYGYDIPVGVILDHGPDFQQCKSAIDRGFTSVMIDGSIDYNKKDEKGKHPPTSLEDNIRVTREVVDYAHKKGVSVEGELGTLGGIEEKTKASKVQLTKPEQVLEFVEKTGVDALAVAIGTSHGAYKFEAEPKLAMNLIPKIYKNARETRLVMHGSSSVPVDLVNLVNSYPVFHLMGAEGENYMLSISGFFGKDKIRESRNYDLNSLTDSTKLALDLKKYSCMKKAMGVPMQQIKEAIKLGIRKINVDTDGRLGTTGAIRRHMAENPENFDQRKYFEKARGALYEMAVDKIKGFGSASHSEDVEMVSLEDMARRYE